MTTPTFAGPQLQESFNKTDSNTLGPDLTWFQNWATGSIGPANSVGVRNQRVTSIIDLTNEEGMARVEHTVPADQMAMCKIVAIGAANNEGAGPVVRVEDGNPSDSFYWFKVERGDASIYEVLKVVNGTFTVLAGTNAAMPAGLVGIGGEAKISVEGSTLRIFYKNTLVQTFTDTGLTAGKIGFIIYDAVVGSSAIDDFKGGPLLQVVRAFGTATPAGPFRKVGQLTKSGTTATVGVLATRRLVFRVLTATVSTAGTILRAFPRSFGGGTAPTGALRNVARLIKSGSVASSGVMGRRANKIPTGVIATTSIFTPTFLGRILGKAGAVIMTVVKRGEIRMRFRRR